MLLKILFVGLGGFLGSAARYLLTLLIKNPERLFPLGTFAVNIIGSFVIGILFALIGKNALSETWRLFLMAGICGGFTTFSAFSL
ncbi:MAG: CrcB family protein, partial [Paludibacter sp.]|nr:CrcB family protein [Paludibacter sp.]